MATAIFTTGKQGHGKTASRCASFLLDVWLKSPGDYVHFSNFPINFEGLINEAKKMGISEDTVRYRVRVIPEDILKKWMLEEYFTGPWDYFADFESEVVNGAHLAIDEAHQIIPRTTCVARRKKWRDYVSHIRHHGMSVEFLTQHPERMDTEIRKICSVNLCVVNQEDERDPLFGILMSDYYQLKAKLDGEWNPLIHEIESRCVNEKWKVTNKRRFYLTKRLFNCYNSFNQINGDKIGGQGKKREYELLSFWGLIFWFFKKNIFNFLFSKGVGLFILIIISIFGIPIIVKEMPQYLIKHVALDAKNKNNSNKKSSIIVNKEDVGIEQKIGEYIYEDGENQVKITADQIPLLLMESEKLKQKIIQLDEDNKLLIEKNSELVQNNVKITAMTVDQVWLNSGEILKVGDLTKFTEPIGKKLLEINYEKNYCNFDGNYIYFGLSNIKKSKGNISKVADISGSFEQIQPVGKNNNQEITINEDNIVGRRPNASRPISPVLKHTDRGLGGVVDGNRSKNYINSGGKSKNSGLVINSSETP